MLQQGVSVKLPTATNTVDKPEVQGQTVTRERQGVYLNPSRFRKASWRPRSTWLLENSNRQDRAHQGRRRGRAQRRDGGDADQFRQAGLRTSASSRTQESQAGEVSNGSRASPLGADKVVKGEVPHASSDMNVRRSTTCCSCSVIFMAALLSREGRRHSAGGEKRRPSPDVSQIVIDYSADKRISVNKQDVTINELE